MSFNITIDSYVVVGKGLVYLKIKVPENKNDKRFRKEWLKTVIDIEKAINGKFNNFLVSLWADEVFKKCEFSNKPCKNALKFPLPKVNFIIYLRKIIKAKIFRDSTASLI